VDQAEINKRFNYHQPQSDEVIDRLKNIRKYAHNFANLINYSVPQSRELSLALTKLEEAMFWANAGIARNQEELND
jgi:hypothetical protein